MNVPRDQGARDCKGKMQPNDVTNPLAKQDRKGRTGPHTLLLLAFRESSLLVAPGVGGGGSGGRRAGRRREEIGQSSLSVNNNSPRLAAVRRPKRWSELEVGSGGRR